MITNQAPRPWHPGDPVKLNCLSTDIATGKPVLWEGTPIANGSKLRVMDQDKQFIFDAENATWYVWTQDGGGGGGSSPGPIATDAEVDEALDTVYPTP